ncbi:hypothetical protein ACVW0Y_001697 [Pseudomonas sp. TE3786]
MKTAAIAAFALIATAPFAFAQSVQATNSKAGADIPTVQYEYGMELDVKKVLSLTDVSNVAGVVPVTMVYQDSQGRVQKVKYLELGGADDHS